MFGKFDILLFTRNPTICSKHGESDNLQDAILEARELVINSNGRYSYAWVRQQGRTLPVACVTADNISLSGVLKLQE